MRLVRRIVEYRAARRADAAMTGKVPSDAITALAEDKAALDIYLRMIKLDQGG